MTKLKPSRYNLYYTSDDPELGWIIGNTLVGSVMVADDELKELIEDPTELETRLKSTPDGALFDGLLANGFVVNADTDEVKRVQIRFAESRYNDAAMHLTIIPATGCNLRCTYCYEDHRGRVMTQDVVDKIAAYVARHADRLGHLAVSWFGGEPLMAKRVIRELSAQLTALSKDKGFTFRSNIVTNGTLLDEACADMLVEAGITSVQITLDGPPDIHNARRFYAKGKAPSFDDVLAGIRNCRGKLMVGIRVNVDRSNIDHYPDLVRQLADEGLIGPGSGNGISLGLVKRWTDLVETEDDQLLSGREFEQRMSDLKTLVADVTRRDGSKDQASDAPSAAAQNAGRQFRPSQPCAAVNNLNFVIMPDGSLKKCWIHATEADTEVGNVATGLNLDQPIAVEWQAYDPTRDPECAACVYLPSCAGGCPFERMERPKKKAEQCAFIRKFTERNVRAAAAIDM